MAAMAAAAWSSKRGKREMASAANEYEANGGSKMASSAWAWRGGVMGVQIKRQWRRNETAGGSKGDGRGAGL